MAKASRLDASTVPLVARHGGVVAVRRRRLASYPLKHCPH
jgi:hypothetical protein